MADPNDVEVRITGTVDPSLAASTSAATAQVNQYAAAVEKLSPAQKLWLANIQAGVLTLEEFAATLSKNAANTTLLTGITNALAAAEQSQSVAVEEATAARISLTKAESEQLAVRLASAKQQSAELMATDAATLAFQQRMMRQRAAEAKATEAAIVADAAAGGRAQEAIDAAAFAFQSRMTKQRAAETLAADAGKTADAAKAGAAQEAIDAATLAFQMRMTRQRIASAAEEEGATKKVAFSTETFFEKLRSGRSVYEAEAAGRAILTGNIGRLGSALAVETTRLGLAQFLFSGTGLAIAGMTAALIAAIAASMQFEESMRKITDSVVGLGSASGYTKDQLIGMSNAVAANMTMSIGESEQAVTAYSQVIRNNQQAVMNLASVTEDYAVLTGTKTAAAVHQLAEEMKNPITASQKLNEQFNFLDANELEQIKTLTELGRITDAQALLSDKLKTRMDEANTASGGLTSGLRELTNAAKDAWNEFGKLIDVLSHYLALTGTFGTEAQGKAFKDEWDKATGASKAAQDKLAADSKRARDSAAGAELFDNTPEGKAMHARIELQGKVAESQKALTADLAAHASADVIARDRQMLEDYHRAATTYLSDAEKKVRADQLDVQIANAKHAHNKQLVAELTEQKSLISQAGVVESEADAKRLAAGAGAVAGARTGAGRGRGASAVQAWAEQLHQQEIASGEFFKDQTEDELKFWQSKLAMVKPHSKEWLEVQAKIYEADKKLAHDDYDDHIAKLDERIAADKENWAKEKADWDEKLEYVKAHFGAEGKEYSNAYKAFEAAEREHEKTMRDIRKEADDEALKELKSNLATARTIRENDAREAESELNYRAKYSANPLAQVQAQQQVAAINRQVAQQNISDLEHEHVLQDQLLQDDINGAKEGTTEWQKAVDAKKLADLEFFNQHRVMTNQMVNQDRAAQQKIAESWHSLVDPMVKTTGDQIKGLIEGTETWGQAIRNIGEQMLSLMIDAIERMVEEWIVNLLMGKAAQSTTAMSQVVSYAGVAGAAGTASMAGAPWPLDMAAPAFGEAMAATALGYGAMASLDTGTNYVPNDMVAQIHEGERIIPKAENATLMSMVAQNAGSSSSSSFTGDFGVHLHGVGNLGDLDGRKVVRALEGAQSHFSKLLKGMHRNGKFSYAG